MPLYDWYCIACKVTFEAFAHFDERAGMLCPHCTNHVTRRVFTPTVNILVPEHFRHNQRDFLPEKVDPAWNKIEMGSGSQSHAKPSAGEQLAKELKSA